MSGLRGADEKDQFSSQTTIVRDFGLSDYEAVWRNMTTFTNERDSESHDEIWLVEHPPVYTLGQAGKEEHLINPNNIPVVKADRGGQVTFHGPGQLVCYPLLNIKRLKIGVRELVQLMAKSVQNTLAHWQIDSQYDGDAPGVYVDGSKISSLGLRIRRGCSFHGLSLNVDMDLSPFRDINPCGYPGLNVIQMKDFFIDKPTPSMQEIKQCWLENFCQLLNVNFQYEKNEVRETNDV